MLVGCKEEKPVYDLINRDQYFVKSPESNRRESREFKNLNRKAGSRDISHKEGEEGKIVDRIAATSINT
jgi:hypothetical protein